MLWVWDSTVQNRRCAGVENRIPGISRIFFASQLFTKSGEQSPVCKPGVAREVPRYPARGGAASQTR
jgi:hypothetical protein